MSQVKANAGEFVIISRVKQNDKENEPEEGQFSNAPASMPKPVVAFYRGEPEVLGTTQIFTGILLISIGIILTKLIAIDDFMALVVISGILFWSGILFIISGWRSVAASVKPAVGKVTSILVMNIFGSLAAVCGIILSALDLSFAFYDLTKSYCAHYKRDIQCLGAFTPLAPLEGIMLFVLLLFILMFCISISSSIFACKTVCRTSFQEMTVVIYQTTSLNVSDPTRDLPPDSTAALTFDLKTQT